MKTDELELPDANVLIALFHRGHVHHESAAAWFNEVRRFATTPFTESAFLRLAMNPKIAGTAVGMADARRSLGSLRADSRWAFLEDDSSLVEPTVDLRGLGGYRQVTDYHLLNLIAGHDGWLATFDRKIAASLSQADRSLVRLLE
ncbi:TA system VapC family ribonuclease toxin [Brevibacterium salitolerans]|uniref:Ribonuclease VapC n=1 Tax=Brevibacterium salitolerans TaxID=1403566 RepID=A0ABN2X2J5_9MICO